MTITEFLNEFTFMELSEDVLAECEHFFLWCKRS